MLDEGLLFLDGNSSLCEIQGMNFSEGTQLNLELEHIGMKSKILKKLSSTNMGFS